jgi:uncharacterized membrane protein
MRKITIVKAGRPYDLAAVCLIVLLSVVASQLGIRSPILWIIAFFSVYFAPGYALTSLLFPSNKVLLLDTLLVKRQAVARHVTGLERLALSFVLSITVVAISGIVLLRGLSDFTAESVGMELLIVTFGASILAYLARSRLPESDQMELSITVFGDSPKFSTAEKIIGVLIICAVVISALTVSGILGEQQGKEKYTEFFITGRDDDLSKLPSILNVSENGIITINLVNHEGRETEYNITLGLSNDSSFTSYNVIDWDGNNTLVPESGYYSIVDLPNEASTRREFTFSIESPGEHRLYLEVKNGDKSKELWIWLVILSLL